MSELVATHPSRELVGAGGNQDQAVTLALAFLTGYTGHTRAAYRRDLADWWPAGLPVRCSPPPPPDAWTSRPPSVWSAAWPGPPAWTADRLSPHSFRHAFVTAALDAGVSLRDVQDAAGHTDPRTTRRYDRARHSLDQRATYAVAAYLAGSSAPDP